MRWVTSGILFLSVILIVHVHLLTSSVYCVHDSSAHKRLAPSACRQNCGGTITPNLVTGHEDYIDQVMKARRYETKTLPKYLRILCFERQIKKGSDEDKKRCKDKLTSRISVRPPRFANLYQIN